MHLIFSFQQLPQIQALEPNLRVKVINYCRYKSFSHWQVKTCIMLSIFSAILIGYLISFHNLNQYLTPVLLIPSAYYYLNFQVRFGAKYISDGIEKFKEQPEK